MCGNVASVGCAYNICNIIGISCVESIKGCRGYGIDRAEAGGCDPEKFFAENSEKRPQTKLLYIFNY